MANNRMFLCHEPSGYYVPLGRRMAGGWCCTADAERIQKLYDLVESQESEEAKDAFILVFEYDENESKLKHCVK